MVFQCILAGTTAIDGTCSTSVDCVAGSTCIHYPNGTFCSQDCNDTTGATCPSGQVCCPTFYTGADGGLGAQVPDGNVCVSGTSC
jgi:hypothetical protein